MDIVPLKSSHLQIKRTKRDAVRRHTTEVSFELLRGRALSELERDTITSLSTENLSGESYNDDNVHTVGEHELSSERSSLNSSWNSFYDGSSGFETSESENNCYYVGSQEEVYKELNEGPKKSHVDGSTKHQYQLSYELALDNVLTPFIPQAPIISPLASSSKPKSRSHGHSLNPRHVIDEVVTTEESYIKDLNDIIDGYFVPFKRKLSVLPIQQRDIDDIFGNILEIRDFHQSLLDSLLESGHYPGEIAKCFLRQAEGFKIYTQYCNNYPRSVSVLKEKSKDTNVSTFLQGCQLRLHHMLPLDAFLLKPVQRVLKYSLLLYEMGKRTQKDSSDYEVVQSALQKMTDVAKHINAVKRKYDMAVHIQEIQSLIRGDWTGLNLTGVGDLVLEENFRYAHYSGRNARFRTERYVFLFQRLCVITKKEEDGYYYLKAHIEMADLQLTEKVEKLPLCFQLRQMSTGKYHTFMTTSQQVKDIWVKSIKLLLVESIPHLPDKARELIMQGFDITPVQSPKRERHIRHSSEDPNQRHAMPYQPDEIRQDAISKSQSMGPFLSQNPGKVLKPKVRSSTLPSIGRQSLMSSVASSVHNSQIIMEEHELLALPEDRVTVYTPTSEHKWNGALLKTHENITSLPQTTGFEDAVNHGKQRTDLELGIPQVQLSQSSSLSPHIGLTNTSDRISSLCLRSAEVQSKLDIYGHCDNNLDIYKDTATLNEVKSGHTNSRSNRYSLPNIVLSGQSHNQLLDRPSATTQSTALNNNHPHPSLEIKCESDEADTTINIQSKRIFTSEEESFFDELMNSNISSPVNSHITCDNTYESDNIIEGNDDNITPIASPSTFRKLSVKMQCTISGNVDEDRLPTPTGSPFVTKPHSSPSNHQSQLIDDLSSVVLDLPTPFRYLSPEPNNSQTSSSLAYTTGKTKSIVRRHSFGSNMQRNMIHHHQESFSLETTPQSTPIMKRSKMAKRAQNSSSQSGHEDSVEALQLQINSGDTTQVEPSTTSVQTSKGELQLLSHENSSNQILLLPPINFMDNFSTCDVSCTKHHEINHQLRPSLNTLPQMTDSSPHTSESSTVLNDQKAALVTPYESNPEEMISFTEVLASFDDYATTTGKTTKSEKPVTAVNLRSQSPPAKRHKQKKKKRSQTVANIDTDTMNQVKEELHRRSQGRQSISQQKSDSKVHQLAREYSRKIKDHQRSRIFKRFSTVVEEPSLPNQTEAETAEPVWLQQLRERKKISSMKDEAASSTSTRSGANVLQCANHHSQLTSYKEFENIKSKTRHKVKCQSDLDEDQQRKGGFKGWVRSLVDKISTTGSIKDK